MQHRRPSRAEIVFLIGVPLAWAVVLLFHPTGDGEDFYPIVRDQLTAWMTVHVATLLFVPLIAAVVYLLLRGVEGTAAQVSRVALAPFVLFYATWEALIGIGVGVLADEVNGLPAPEQDAGAKVLEDLADSGMIRAFELIGTGSLFVALTAAGIALRRRAGAPLLLDPDVAAVAGLSRGERELSATLVARARPNLYVRWALIDPLFLYLRARSASDSGLSDEEVGRSLAAAIDEWAARMPIDDFWQSLTRPEARNELRFLKDSLLVTPSARRRFGARLAGAFPESRAVHDALAAELDVDERHA